MNRRAINYVILCLAAILISGCMTDALFKDRRYHETVFSFQVSEDGKTVVVLGDAYHYTFDAPSEFVKIVQSSIRADVVPELTYFRVANDNSVRGVCNLIYGKKDAELLAEAKSIGFVLRGTAGPYQLRMSFSGRRFSTDGFAIAKVKDHFNKPYLIDVYEEQSVGEKLVKAPLTPVTVVGDGILTLMLHGVVVPIFSRVGGK